MLLYIDNNNIYIHYVYIIYIYNIYIYIFRDVIIYIIGTSIY